MKGRLNKLAENKKQGCLSVRVWVFKYADDAAAHMLTNNSVFFPSH